MTSSKALCAGELWNKHHEVPRLFHRSCHDAHTIQFLQCPTMPMHLHWHVLLEFAVSCLSISCNAEVDHDLHRVLTTKIVLCYYVKNHTSLSFLIQASMLKLPFMYQLVGITDLYLSVTFWRIMRTFFFSNVMLAVFISLTPNESCLKYIVVWLGPRTMNKMAHLRLGRCGFWGPASLPASWSCDSSIVPPGGNADRLHQLLPGSVVASPTNDSPNIFF